MVTEPYSHRRSDQGVELQQWKLSERIRDVRRERNRRNGIFQKRNFHWLVARLKEK